MMKCSWQFGVMAVAVMRKSTQEPLTFMLRGQKLWTISGCPNALLRLGVPDVDSENCKKLVGIGSNGASANIARGGLKG